MYPVGTADSGKYIETICFVESTRRDSRRLGSQETQYVVIGRKGPWGSGSRTWMTSLSFSVRVTGLRVSRRYCSEKRNGDALEESAIQMVLALDTIGELTFNYLARI